jgi:hypothetical protein
MLLGLLALLGATAPRAARDVLMPNDGASRAIGSELPERTAIISPARATISRLKLPLSVTRRAPPRR